MTAGNGQVLRRNFSVAEVTQMLAEKVVEERGLTPDGEQGIEVDTFYIADDEGVKQVRVELTVHDPK